MLAEAEKFAYADKEKREKIDLKNQAEALCFEAEKEVSMFKEKITQEQQQNITKLIENVREEIKNDNFDSLKVNVEKLKTVMKEIIADKTVVDNNSGGMNDL